MVLLLLLLKFGKVPLALIETGLDLSQGLSEVRLGLSHCLFPRKATLEPIG
jgi:hypothetical protein